MTGFLIAFEGGEACGKSTQAGLLAERLSAVLTREPGGTEVGLAIRSLLLDPDGAPVAARTEALLMAADRAEHYASVVAPALHGGRHVVSDRSAGSSLAYQGYGRGLDLEGVRSLSDWALDGRWPDIAVLVRVPADVAAARAIGRPDRLEQAGAAFHSRVLDGFDVLAASSPSPSQWVVVDGCGSVDDVAARVWAAVEPRL